MKDLARIFNQTRKIYPPFLRSSSSSNEEGKYSCLIYSPIRWQLLTKNLINILMEIHDKGERGESERERNQVCDVMVYLMKEKEENF